MEDKKDEAEVCEIGTDEMECMKGNVWSTVLTMAGIVIVIMIVLSTAAGVL